MRNITFQFVAILLALGAAHAETPSLPDATALPGKWEAVTRCYDRDVLVTAILWDDGAVYASKREKWAANVHYWTWDGDREGKILRDWTARGAMNPGANRIVLSPTYTDFELSSMKRGKKLWRYDMIFEKTGEIWAGMIPDPGCDPDPVLQRPGPPKLIDSRGEAMTGKVWLGRSPFSKIGTRTFFDYSKMPAENVLLMREYAMAWSNVVDTQSGFVFFACDPNDAGCLSSKRMFVVIPGDVMWFGSALSQTASQVCRFPVKYQAWYCNEVAKPFPSHLSDDQLARWIRDETLAQELAWERANPGIAGQCRTVTTGAPGDWNYSKRRVCDPGIPGRAKPPSPRR